MSGLTIQKYYKQIDGIINIQIPKEYFADVNEACNFILRLRKMRSFKFARLNIGRTHYEYLGMFLRPWRPKYVQMLVVSIDKKYKQFKTEQI